MRLDLDLLVQATLCKPEVAAQWEEPLQEACQKWEILTPHRLGMFLSQIAVESGRLSRFTENLNYSAQGLANTWPKRYAVDPRAAQKVPNQLALKLHRNPQLIANYTYANRMGNRGPESGDGWWFRGRGPKQITGSDNYHAYQKVSGVPVVEQPDLLLVPMYGADAAGWYWYSAGCNEKADAGDYEAVSLAINGGLIGHEDGNQVGLDDRVEYWVHAQQVLGIA